MKIKKSSIAYIMTLNKAHYFEKNPGYTSEIICQSDLKDALNFECCSTAETVQSKKAKLDQVTPKI